MTDLVILYSGTDEAPGPWAAAREAEGWDGLAVADHLWVNGQPIRHVFVTLAEMAAATRTVGLSSAFANNLVRSPVELAQAALSLHAMSGGRFTVGLGAGWDEGEAVATSVPFPPAGERSERLGEAAHIVGSLLREGSCRFEGRWYAVDVGSIGPAPGPHGPPLLAVAATGPRTVERVIDAVDILELKAAAFSVPGKGTMDLRAAAAITADDLAAAVARARLRRPEVRLSTFLAVGCTDEPMVGVLRERLGGSVMAGLFGAPAEVAAALAHIAGLGFDRLLLGPVTTGTPAALAPHLPVARRAL